MTLLTAPQLEARIEELRVEMESWAAGRLSWANLGHDPDVTSMLDTNEVTKRASMIRAYTAMMEMEFAREAAGEKGI